MQKTPNSNDQSFSILRVRPCSSLHCNGYNQRHSLPLARNQLQTLHFQFRVQAVNDAPHPVIQLFPVARLDGQNTNLLVISPNNSNAIVLLDASLSSDVEGDPLQFYWVHQHNLLPFAEGPAVLAELEIAEHWITLMADDGMDMNKTTVAFEIIHGCAAVEALMLTVSDSTLAPHRKHVHRGAVMQHGKSVPMVGSQLATLNGR